MAQKYADPIITGKVRAQYVNLEEVEAGHKYSSGTYSLTALINKKNSKEITRPLKKAIEEVSEVDSIDELEKHPFIDTRGKAKDGDLEKHSKKEGFAGHLFIKVRSGADRQPKTFILDESGEPQECDPSEIYAGCYVQLVLIPALYEEGKATFYLDSVVKVADGKPFKAGRTSSKALIKGWLGKNKDEDEDEEVPVKAKKAKKPVKEEEDDEEEVPVTKKSKKPAPVDDDEEESEEEDDEEEDDKPKKRRGRPPGSTNKKKGAIAAKHTRQEEDDDEDEEEDEDEEPVKPKKSKKPVKDEEEDEETDEEEEDEEPVKAKKKSSVSALLDD